MCIGRGICRACASYVHARTLRASLLRVLYFSTACLTTAGSGILNTVRRTMGDMIVEDC